METRLAKQRSPAPEIWAIGGGKGGTGKSFLISSIGNYLALRGKKIVLIDADFGGANLHTFLGVAKPRVSLTDFLEKKVPLNDLVVESGIENMGLLIGAINSLGPDDMKYTQKLKLFRHIRQLDADYILLDLGAGAHFNTLDTFLLADKKIIVVLPEITAIENSYYFLKNAFYRQLLKTLGAHGFKELIQDAWRNREAYNITSLSQLIDYLRSVSGTLEDMVNRELAGFGAHIILNRVTTGQEVVIGRSVKSICKKYFSVDAKYVGYVEHDPIIPRCINKRQPFMQACPGTRCAREIEKVAENLLHGKDMYTRV
ncbi:MAG: P-loop NTPase [Deltaproteobacteria bacterium]|nr:P-loop NTPase [Deltaproteobacteria bacterium]